MSLPDLDSLWDFSDPAANERRFAERLSARAGAPAEERAEILTQLARSQGLQRKFAQAHATLDGATPLTGQGRARVRLELERGRVFNSSGSPTEARHHFQDAWDRALALGEDGLAVDAAHMLAIVGPDALKWNEQALALARASSQPAARRWLGSLYNNIGWTFHDSGRADDALTMFRLALDERERAGKRAPLLVARWTVARALRTLGRSEEALAAQLGILGEHARDGTSDGFVHEEIAENLLALGRTTESRGHFAKAFDLLSGDVWLREKDPARVKRLAELAGREPPPDART